MSETIKKIEEAVLTKGLTKSYQGRTVLKDLNLSVKAGTVFGLLGANGAGKSTTIECILGTKQADGGTALVLGRDAKKERRNVFQKVGVQFQEGDYQPEIKVSELCGETACLYGRPADWRKLCERFGIGDKIGYTVKGLSGGERQRLFIVLALIPNPELVFLDELTTGLDARARRTVWKILEELKGEGLTIFLTSHYAAIAAKQSWEEHCFCVLLYTIVMKLVCENEKELYKKICRYLGGVTKIKNAIDFFVSK